MKRETVEEISEKVRHVFEDEEAVQCKEFLCCGPMSYCYFGALIHADGISDDRMLNRGEYKYAIGSNVNFYYGTYIREKYGIDELLRSYIVVWNDNQKLSWREINQKLMEFIENGTN